MSRFPGPLSVFSCLLCVAGCATVLTPQEAREGRALRAEADADAHAAAALVAAIPVEAARLEIARRQDARADHEGLVGFLGHADAGVRAAATRAVALVGDHRAGDVLLHQLGDSTDAIALEAAFGLGQLPSWSVTDLERMRLTMQIEEGLLAELDDCRRELRWGDVARSELCRVVVRSLGAVGGEATSDALWDQLSRGIATTELQRAVPLALAVQSKAGRGAPITVERLSWLAPLLIERDHPAQWAAAYLLARAGVAEEARPAAVTLLSLAWARAESETARAWLLRALGKHDPDSAIVTAVLRDSHAAGRLVVNAARGAGPAHRLALQERLAAPDRAGVKAEVLAAFARVAAESATPEEIAAGLQTASLSADALVWGALAPLIAFPPVRDAAFTLLLDPNPRLRSAGAELLTQNLDEAVTDALIALLATETERGVRISVVAALAERPAASVEGALLRLVVGDDEILAAIAAEGLGPRPGGHVMAALAAAFTASQGEREVERRLAIVKAIDEREDAPIELLKGAMTDSSLLVRREAQRVVTRRFDRATTSEIVRGEALSDLPDGWFGVGDVLGATVVTARGTLELDLFPRLAPGAVSNFVHLAERGWFDGMVFHRVVEDFVVQTGDPLGTGWGGPGTTIRCETSAAEYTRGTVGMALSGRDTGGSQWFVTVAPQPHLDGGYTVFGQVTAGWDALDGLQVGDRLESVTIHRRAGGPRKPSGYAE